MTPEDQTLTQRLAAGRLPLAETLRYALQIADALRHAHEEGFCHGALTPDTVMLTRTGAELIPPQPGAVEALTPYTAPERIKGHAPDTRTDIYALGAILYEMITGRRAFEASEIESLADVIENSVPAPIGDTALDRLVLNCLVKDPAGRWQRVQQVHMEIKILSFSARRAQAAASPRPEVASQAELRHSESRLAARLDEHANTLSGLQQAAGELPQMEARLTSCIEQRMADAAEGVRRIAAELPRLESHWASCLENQHREAMSRVQQAASDAQQFEARLAERLSGYDQKLSHLGDAAAGVPQLAARMEQQEQTVPGLASRLDQLEQKLDAVTSAPPALPEFESRLVARLEQQEQSLSGLTALSSRVNEFEQKLTNLPDTTAELPQLESRLSLRLEQQEQTLTGLCQAASEQFSVVQTASSVLGTIQEQIGRLETDLSSARERVEKAEQFAGQMTEVAQRETAGLQMALSSELRALELTVKSHASAIESIRGAMARTDDFMERVVEALESLQSMVLERSSDRPA